MSSSLPERPDLDQLRRQAKELRDSARRPGRAEHLVDTIREIRAGDSSTN
jgi:hypothetical protein